MLSLICIDEQGKALCRKRYKSALGVTNTPNSSRTASEAVRDVIERDAAIRSSLARSLINTRALARQIQVATNERFSFDALVAAIRRYPIKERITKANTVASVILRLGLKNKLVEVTIQNEPGTPVLLSKFSEQVDYGRGEMLTIISGVRNALIIIDSSNLDKLRRIIPKKCVLSVIHNLAAVIVTFDTELAIKTSGLIAAITTEIAIEEISIIDFVPGFEEAYVIIDQKDAVRAYQALERLSAA
ncbi:MAG TPA: hypothetical protein VEC43_00575 [Candidatus Acidoferrales bacterium]|nr:hypothetical protein [Candidatus Acidoferrales bacterium]